MASKIEKQFAEFAKSYKDDRYKFWHLVGQNFGSGIKRFFLPFRDWDESHVIGTETRVTQSSINSLRSILGELHDSEVDELSLISLVAKNRAEIMAAKSDFYPVYSALLGVSLAAIVILAPAFWLKIVAAAGVVFFVATSAVIRMSTREQVAYLRELSNLLDHVANHPSAAHGSGVAG